MSREMVACVASKPRWRSRRRSCSWLWSASRSTSSRMAPWRRDFMCCVSERSRIHDLCIDSREHMHRLPLIQLLRLYKYSFRCIHFPAGGHDTARTGTAPPCASPSPAQPATPGRNCSGCWLVTRRVDCGRHLLGRDGAARKLPALARIWNGSITPLDPDDARARRRHRVPRAAGHGGGGARATARRRGRAGHRSVGCVSAAGRAARARWYPETHALPAGSPTA